MSNTFGRFFRVTTWGESHGTGIGCVVDGCPSGLGISREEIQEELDRRKPAQSPVTTGRKEEDAVEILSGIFDRKTIGSPISMMIRNIDIDSSGYELIRDKPRPGHADLTWRQKFGISDWRGGGRLSGRETAARVAAGAIAGKLLRRSGVGILAYSKEIAGMSADGIDFTKNINLKKVQEIRKKIYSNSVRTIDAKKAEDMEKAIIDAKSEKDSVGGIIEAIVFNAPAGLGEPVFWKLDADIANALMGIPSVKGVEIGKGFELARMKGSESNDEFFLKDKKNFLSGNFCVAEPKGLRHVSEAKPQPHAQSALKADSSKKIYTKTNNSGGILGGISNGMPIVVRIAVKPTSSIGKEQKTIDLKTMKETTIRIEGRHDPCIVPRAVPVVESMLALVLVNHSIASGFIPRCL